MIDTTTRDPALDSEQWAHVDVNIANEQVQMAVHPYIAEQINPTVPTTETRTPEGPWTIADKHANDNSTVFVDHEGAEHTYIFQRETSSGHYIIEQPDGTKTHELIVGNQLAQLRHDELSDREDEHGNKIHPDHLLPIEDPVDNYLFRGIRNVQMPRDTRLTVEDAHQEVHDYYMILEDNERREAQLKESRERVAQLSIRLRGKQDDSPHTRLLQEAFELALTDYYHDYKQALDLGVEYLQSLGESDRTILRSAVDDTVDEHLNFLQAEEVAYAQNHTDAHGKPDVSGYVVGWSRMRPSGQALVNAGSTAVGTAVAKMMSGEAQTAASIATAAAAGSFMNLTAQANDTVGAYMKDRAGGLVKSLKVRGLYDNEFLKIYLNNRDHVATEDIGTVIAYAMGRTIYSRTEIDRDNNIGSAYRTLAACAGGVLVGALATQ